MLEASRQRFVGLRALPLFEVDEQSGQYPVIPIEAMLKLPDTKRAARGAYNRGDWEFEMGNYDCEEHGWEEPVDDTEAKLYRRFFDAEQVAVMRSMDAILRNQEKRVADMLLNESNFSVNDVTNEWDDAANATPRDDVKAGANSMYQNTGLYPNVLIISKSIFDNVMKCDQVTSNIKYTTPILYEPMDVQRRLLAQFFDLDDILIGPAVYDSADKGQAASPTPIWGEEHGMLARVATRPQDLREPCLGRTFLWRTDSPANVVVEQYREEQIRSNIYRSRQYVDEAFVFTGAGYLLGNLTT
jgi:hypothetical protein